MDKTEKKEIFPKEVWNQYLEWMTESLTLGTNIIESAVLVSKDITKRLEKEHKIYVDPQIILHELLNFILMMYQKSETIRE